MLVFNILFQTKFSNQILTPKQLFDFARANFDGATSFFVSSVEVVSTLDFLSRDLLHQTHLKEHRVIINSFPTLQALVLQ